MTQLPALPRIVFNTLHWLAVALAIICAGVMVASLRGLIPWQELYRPDSSWSSLFHPEIGANTAILCGGIGTGFLLLVGGGLLVSLSWVQDRLGPAPAIVLSRVTTCLAVIAVATSSCLWVNLDRTVDAELPAHYLIEPLEGPQLAIAFFLHDADDDGVVLTLVTILAMLVFGIAGLAYARRIAVASPHWLNTAAHLTAGVVGLGVWVALDRMLPKDTFLPLSEDLYVWMIQFVLVLAVPVAYVLVGIEVGLGQGRSIARLWRHQRRVCAGITGLASLVWMSALIAPVIAGLYLALFYQPPAASLVRDDQGNLLQARHPADHDLRLYTDDIAPEMLQAIEAIEDPGLFTSPKTHSPINLVTVVGSLNRIRHGDLSGASGLAMQTCKLWTGTPLTGSPGDPLAIPKRMLEKLFETPCAWTLEKVGGADRVLNLYLNMTPVGCFGEYGQGQLYGVETASRVYFNKPASDLIVTEAAMIARLPQLPCYYDPWQVPEAVTSGRNDVLSAMAERQHYLSLEEAEWLMQQPLGVGVEPQFPPTLSEAFVERAMAELAENDYSGFSTNGSTVITTLDPELQAALENACRAAVINQQASGINDCGAILLHRDPDNLDRLIVAAYVGTLYSISGPDAMPDLVADQVFPVGSTIKGLLYACALYHQVLDPDEILHDPGTTQVAGQQVGNWDLGAVGYKPASEMLTLSRNVPAAVLVERLSPNGFAQCLAEQFGVDGELRPEHWKVWMMGRTEITLWELAAGYTAFLTGGEVIEPTLIDHVLIREGETLTLEPTEPHRAVGCGESAWVTQALLEAGRREGLPAGVALKTGTTNASSVAVTFTPDWVLATWLGNIQAKQPPQAVSDTAAAKAVAAEFASWYYAYAPVPAFRPCGV